MSKKSFLYAGLIVLAVAVVAAIIAFSAPRNKPAAASSNSETTNPQRLLIPRWFLTSLTVNGQKVDLPEKHLTLQFEENGNANGESGCNSFGGPYQVSPDGKLSFGALASTMMACDTGMQQEAAYFQALASVQKFSFIDYKLHLTSADGKTELIFSMPPK